ncbi:hypothetical protein COJ01_17675 [Priestia megaterium]|uniref:hypothetical protein n=1 Tax=Priestia megaterium TaxID=1404 RepID=UPI000BF7248F|nr:hypothetical protein [Priestia megaterium]PFK99892.1 hypothetical protein COJ01_17675 [Priestia megaterium]
MSKIKLSIHNDMASGTYVNEDDQYNEFLSSVRKRFKSLVNAGTKLFTTNATGLYEAYLGGLPEEARQHYNCRCCKNFIERYGSLVTISDSGEMQSALWDENETPSFFVESVYNMKELVLKEKVSGVFYSEFQTLGQPFTGEWEHLSVSLPKELVFRPNLLNARQLSAEKREDFKMLINALLDYSQEVVEQAVALLKTESLYRSEKCLGVAEWFLSLIEHRAAIKNYRNKENLVWLAVATAPVGFCHIRSSMIGTLLDDIASGMEFEDVSRRFADKMHPLQYQRPQAAPSAGNIAEAERIVEKLGIQKSFARRFARLDELETLWTPKGKKEAVKSGGMFSHLETKGKKALPKMDMPAITMTWKKFSETVLPFAEEIEYNVKSVSDNYSAILTAVHEDAPPILKWDTEEKRNPFSWYVYNGGSPANRWNLSPGYRKVTGITLQPSMWHDENAHQGKSVFFIIEGAKDNRHQGAGNALFPETLKSELRAIRSTIEAYSRNETIEGYDEASACGVRLQYGSNWNTLIRVTTKTGTATYKLDRWD